MITNSPKYETNIQVAQGTAIGDHNTVTNYFQNNDPPPFFAPLLPTYSLVGRDDLLHGLKQHLFGGENLALSALDGLPGVGKTALAVGLGS